MKKTIKILAVLIGFGLLAVAAIVLLTPWMDRWGATNDEIAATFPGDELLASPASFVNRAVTIHASPEQIYPWIVQLGAGKGGYYSYTWLETYLLNCPLVNADRIHSEWQDLKVGDEVKMCPKQPGPPPYTVAMIKPDQAVVLGHQENGKWVDIWHVCHHPSAGRQLAPVIALPHECGRRFLGRNSPGYFYHGARHALRHPGPRRRGRKVTDRSLPCLLPGRNNSRI